MKPEELEILSMTLEFQCGTWVLGYQSKSWESIVDARITYGYWNTSEDFEFLLWVLGFQCGSWHSSEDAGIPVPMIKLESNESCENLGLSIAILWEPLRVILKYFVRKYFGRILWNSVHRYVRWKF